MSDHFRFTDVSLDKTKKIFYEATQAHEEQRLQGFFSSIGMMSGDYVNFQLPQKLVVVGDLHGDLESLRRILSKIDYENYLKEEENILVFLGDYIDRGSFSLEVLLTLCSLKITFPNNVILLIGNHEAYHKFAFSSFNFASDLKKKYDNEWEDLYSDFVIPLFNSMNVVCEIDSFAICLHGGVPVTQDTKLVENYKFHFSDLKTNKSLLEELLWNDPREFVDIDWQISNRGLGKYFGDKITKIWLSQTHCNFIIRGHEPCKGFKTNHDSKVLTIFSSKQPYPKFESGYLAITNNDIINCIQNKIALKNFIILL